MKKNYCLLTVSGNYSIGWFIFPGKVKRKRFQYRYEAGVFEINYKNLWFPVKEIDFLKDK